MEVSYNEHKLLSIYTQITYGIHKFLKKVIPSWVGNSESTVALVTNCTEGIISTLLMKYWHEVRSKGVCCQGAKWQSLELIAPETKAPSDGDLSGFPHKDCMTEGTCLNFVMLPITSVWEHHPDKIFLINLRNNTQTRGSTAQLSIVALRERKKKLLLQVDGINCHFWHTSYS